MKDIALLRPTASELHLLKTVCSIPTAPFVEGRVVRFVEEFVAGRKHLRLKRDAAGNLLISQKGGGGNRWIFAAHMDHPGAVWTEPTYPRGWKKQNAATLARHLKAGRHIVAFRGGVYCDYLRGSTLEWFGTTAGDSRAVDKPIARGRVIECLAEPKKLVPFGLVVEVDGEVPVGSAGMFPVKVARAKDGFLHSRVCDDLAGAAAALALVDKPVKAKVPVCVLLTRGEEEGFVGALAAVHAPTLLKQTDRIIAIECSAEQTYAPAGQGVVLRCGDKTSIFHSGLTYFMNECGKEAALKTKGFVLQRALMPGGTCESTVYDAWGYVSGAVCVPLRNYHNMDKAAKMLAAEAVHLGDWACMVRLFREIALKAHTFAEGHPEIRERLGKLYLSKIGLMA